MKWSPLINAGAAAAYIALVVLFMNFIQSLRHDTPDTLFDGMGVISLLVFSAAVMAFLFFYQPVVLLVENKKAEALSFFLKTLGMFGLILVVVLALAILQ
ncbi:MAG: hypothetical protein AB202_04065 [Parcubacteria bacterium C7867-007]|nr:MAG: hypothetical protein AB202_04065 [Parcubacteria bacterium C7867-007]